MDKILQQLKRKGYKLTPQRTEILKILMSFKAPASAQDVYQKLRADYPHISLDTVYRNLSLFTSVGIVNQINLQNPGSAMFEYQDTGHHHHHAVCLGCEKSFCIESCPVPESVFSGSPDPGFRMTGHAFEVYGYCSECQKSDKIRLAAMQP